QSTSLYRRHRPRTFDDVVGQEHVVRTLQNAVTRGMVHHAYLFVGSRGTGKTSMAKILAACLNCERGPTVEPCGVCESCVSIANATSLDVIEMDAASSNSVDDLRDLPDSGADAIEIPDEAVAVIARSATGSFRDALGTLEQLVTYSGNQIELADVLAVLGVADAELLFEALDAVAAGDARAALLAVGRCVGGGREPAAFIRDLETHARELLVVATLDG